MECLLALPSPIIFVSSSHMVFASLSQLQIYAFSQRQMTYALQKQMGPQPSKMNLILQSSKAQLINRNVAA